MEKINKWLFQFTTAWKNHDADKVLELFSNDVEYWETPFERLDDFGKLKSEWRNIIYQKSIDIKCDIFSNDGDKYVIKWSLKYLDKNNKIKKFGGVYLIKLNANNKCNYFFHCGESNVL
ncbi:MAG: nuclear transport factor 2 family protein [Candidatus Moraniibacteriota bacterium]